MSGLNAPEPAELDRTVLLVDGQEYGGWIDVKITRGLEHAAASFELSVSERWPQQPSPEPWQIMPGAECVLKVNEDVVLTGWVDSYAPSVNATGHEVRVSGRSKTCDFVDSSVTEDGGQFKNMTLQQIVERLAAPFHLPVKIDPSFQGTPIPEVQVQQGETCFELAEKLSRLQECLITDDETGALVLTRAGAGKCSSRLEQGRNIMVASVTRNNAERFSTYIVKAQRPGGRTQDKNPDIVGSGGPDTGDDTNPDDDYSGESSGGEGRGESLALRRWRMDVKRQVGALRATPRSSSGGKARKPLSQVGGAVSDPGITRYRPKVILAESSADDADAAKRADWECRRRIGKAIELEITVTGWRQTDGRLWLINEMVPVTAPWLSLDNTSLVISEVAFSAGAGGQTTALKLTLPDAFLPEHTRQAKKPTTTGGAVKADPWAGIVPVPGAGKAGP